MGTLVNIIAVVVGGAIGVILKSKISEKFLEQLSRILGVSVIIMGIIEIIPTMIVIEDGVIKSQHTLLLMISMILGYAIGYILKLDLRIKQFGNFVERKIGKEGFSRGFVSASVICCVGALTITGSIMDGLGDPSVIYIKSVMDFISCIILGSTLGYGVMFSAVIVGIYQGIIALCAGSLNAIMPPELLNMIAMVGYAIVIVLGLNFTKMTKIKSGNLLHVLLIPVIYYLLNLL